MGSPFPNNNIDIDHDPQYLAEKFSLYEWIGGHDYLVAI